MASQPETKFAQSTFGADRVLYELDYHEQADLAEVRAMDALDINGEENLAFYLANAEKLFALQDKFR
jgi:hypothetical protein